jgi:hypothetical protein
MWDACYAVWNAQTFSQDRRRPELDRSICSDDSPRLKPDSYTQIFEQQEECGGDGRQIPSRNKGENGSPFPVLPVKDEGVS